MKKSIGIESHCTTGLLTGAATYVSNLMHNIEKLYAQDPITCYSNRVPSHCSPFRTVVIPKLPLWTSVWLPLYHLTHPVPEVMLYPAHVLPMYSPAINVVTIFDLAFEIFPETFTTRDRLRLQRLTRYSVQHADHLIAISHSTKRDLEELYGLGEERVSVIHLGYDEQRFRPVPLEETRHIKEKYGLHRPYLITVGTLQKRKNHLTILRAMKQLVDRGVELDLVLTGTKGWGYKELFAEIEQFNLTDYVKWTGYADLDDLAALYSGAEAGVLVSLYEGFGLPVLETLACGTPMIVSNVSSLPEVGGEAVLMVDPLDVAGLADQIERLLSDTALQETLLLRAKEHLLKFSWHKTAKETMQLLQRVTPKNSR